MVHQGSGDLCQDLLPINTAIKQRGYEFDQDTLQSFTDPTDQTYLTFLSTSHLTDGLCSRVMFADTNDLQLKDNLAYGEGSTAIGIGIPYIICSIGTPQDPFALDDFYKMRVNVTDRQHSYGCVLLRTE